MPPMSRPIPMPNKCGMVRASPAVKATGAAASVFITTTRYEPSLTVHVRVGWVPLAWATQND